MSVLKGSDTKTEVRAWTGCILLFSLSSSRSAGEEPETIRDSLKLGAYVSFFLLALAQPLVCQKGMQTERKSLAEQVHLFIPPLLLPVGRKLVLSPAYISFIQSGLQ